MPNSDPCDNFFLSTPEVKVIFLQKFVEIWDVFALFFISSAKAHR